MQRGVAFDTGRGIFTYPARGPKGYLDTNKYYQTNKEN
jgi:hypothetical protein